MKTTLPTIGIRPTIDGRRLGVRESLEDQTMNMAKAAAALIEANIRHASGEPVKCIIADSCIGGPAEAAACADKFKANNVGVSLAVTPCWCYGSETFDMDPCTPKAIWGFNGTERPGAVYLAAALAGLNQKGLPAFSIYGKDVQDADDTSIPADVAEKILRFCRAGLAVATMRGKGYLSIGGCAMGIAGSIVDQSFWEKYLGIRVQAVDMTEVRRRMDQKIYDEEEYKIAMQWADAHFKFAEDRNRPDLKLDEEGRRRTFKESVLMAMIFRDMMQGNPKLKEIDREEEGLGYQAIVGGFQGQRHWTDIYPNGDIAETLLNSSFDWNGPRAPMPFATENDSLNGACLLFGYLLTGQANVFADVRTYWSPEAVERVTGWKPEGLAKDGFIHLINSGAVTLDASGQCEIDGKPAMKHWWDITPEEAAKCFDATQYCYGDLFYFRGGGYSSHLTSRGGMPVTMSRLNMVDGLGPVLQIAEGWTCELPKEVHDTLDKRTDPTWPTTWFVPRLTGKDAFTDVYSVMNNWGANHGAFHYGHIGADLITLASMLRIPVCMHNVPEKDIFRPSTWNAFGTKDREGADFRACKALGALYGKY